MQTIKSVRLLVTSRDLATHHVPWAYKETTILEKTGETDSFIFSHKEVVLEYQSAITETFQVALNFACLFQGTMRI